MTLPNMKIWTGGDREYTERCVKAMCELGCKDGSIKDAPFPLYVINEDGVAKVGVVFGAYEGCRRDAYRLADNGNLVPAEADDEGWIAWHGGECPVDPSVRVDIRLRSEREQHGERKACDYRWDFRLSQGDIIAYRVPSQVFETSQKLERKPVHQMKHGDYILREDIPDEATFRRVCEVLERQGVPMKDSWESLQACSRIVVSCLRAASFAGSGGNASYSRRGVTLSDLGITTDTQETDMTPCEKKGLREGQWVWFAGIPEEDRGAEWVRLDEDGASIVPYFRSPSSRHRWCLDLGNHIDWSAGIHNEKPGTELDMGETPETGERVIFDAPDLLTANAIDGGGKSDQRYDAVHGEEGVVVGRGHDEDHGKDIVVVKHKDMGYFALWPTGVRRKPRTVRINGNVSEETVRRLRNLRTGDPGESLNEALDEILGAVQDQ